jgi:hypothetical protein
MLNKENPVKNLALFPIAVLITAVIPIKAASTCDAVIAATSKVLQVPAHLYMTRTAGYNGGKTKNSETIYVNGATYVKVDGPWVTSTITPKDLADGKKQEAAQIGICTLVRDEAVNGEPSTLYKVHRRTADDSIDTQIWISKARSLPLKQVYDLDVHAGAAGKSHNEVRYEYTGVTPPAVTEPKRK